jgi:acyl-CoA hydrolase
MSNTSASGAIVTDRPGSDVHLDEWVAPDVADEHDLLRAGKILEWMDVIGSLAATRHAGRPAVTASVDGLHLGDPPRIGQRLTLTAQVSFTSERSMGVSVVMTHGPASSSKILEGYMTFCAVDEEGAPTVVPQVVPQTPDEIARFREGALRREFRKKLECGDISPVASMISVEALGSEARPLFVRELLKILPRSIRSPWDRDAMQPRARRDSYVHKIEMVRDGKLNFHGTLYGGTLMRWIETTANLSARAHMGGPVRFASLHGMTFLRPVHRSAFVHIRAMVVHTTSASLTTLVTVQAEDALGGRHTETLRAFLTFVPLGDRPPPVPPLECVGDEEGALFKEVEHRLELQRVLIAS